MKLLGKQELKKKKHPRSPAPLLPKGRPHCHSRICWNSRSLTLKVQKNPRGGLRRKWGDTVKPHLSLSLRNL